MLRSKLILTTLFISSVNQCGTVSLPLLSQTKEFATDPAFSQLGKASFYIEKISNNTGKDIELVFLNGDKMVIKNGHEAVHKIIIPLVDTYEKYCEGTFYIHEKNSTLNNPLIGYVHLSLVSRYRDNWFNMNNEYDLFTSELVHAQDCMNSVSRARFEDNVDLKNHARVAFKINLELIGPNLEQARMGVIVLQDDLKYNLGSMPDNNF